jgi:hypothetical protein
MARRGHVTFALVGLSLTALSQVTTNNPTVSGDGCDVTWRSRMWTPLSALLLSCVLGVLLGCGTSCYCRMIWTHKEERLASPIIQCLC